MAALPLESWRTRCGDPAGLWTIRVSASWRIAFLCDGAEAVGVELTDCHRGGAPIRLLPALAVARVDTERAR